MLLVYPPSARIPEPPLGIARLGGALRAAGIDASCLDLNLEGKLYLLSLELEGRDAWTRGALKRRSSSIEALRDIGTYGLPDAYMRAVKDLGRALKAASQSRVSLDDYSETERSPLKRADLVEAGRNFEENLFYPFFARRLGDALRETGDPWLGVSVCFLSQALCALAIAGIAKAARPGLKVVLGGGLVTSWLATGALAPSEDFGGLVDRLVAGRGEEALEAMLGLKSEGPSSRPEPPSFAGLDLDAYLAPRRIVPYNFSSGCPWKSCRFCPETAEGMPYSGLGAGRAMEELRSLAADYDPGLLHFTDSEVSPLYLRSLSKEGPGLPWYGFARFSSALLDPDFCAALSRSGCAMLQLGLESADQEVLDAMGKGTRLDEIDAILRNLKAASIGTYVYVLFGTPWEDRDAALKTRDYLASRNGLIDFLNIAIFNLPASGPEARRLETSPFYEGDLSLYRRFAHPSGWGRARVRDFVAREVEGLTEIRDIVKRTPPVFSSSHAPFFLKHWPLAISRTSGRGESSW
jgi:Fe-S oxidoreductase